LNSLPVNYNATTAFHTSIVLFHGIILALSGSDFMAETNPDSQTPPKSLVRSAGLCGWMPPTPGAPLVNPMITDTRVKSNDV